jgi:hypothetical protein
LKKSENYRLTDFLKFYKIHREKVAMQVGISMNMNPLLWQIFTQNSEGLAIQSRWIGAALSENNYKQYIVR